MEIIDNKHLTFFLENEEYGIPIKKVKEIIGILDITPIPKSPDYLKGVINLRGKIIPVIDLRLKFSIPSKEYNQRTCIVVVELTVSGEKKLVGAIVDTVSEVASVPQSDIESPPQYGGTVSSAFLTGIGKVKGRIVLLLDVDNVLKIEELLCNN